jgi:hypothetical protein
VVTEYSLHWKILKGASLLACSTKNCSQPLFNAAVTFLNHRHNGTVVSVHIMMTHRRNGGTAPCTIAFGTTWRSIVTFVPGHLPHGKEWWYALDMRLGGPQS